MREAIASYIGLVPSEESSRDRRRLGHISKQDNALLRFLLVEEAQVTVPAIPNGAASSSTQLSTFAVKNG